MTGGAVLAAEVAQLETLDLEALRALWRQLTGGRLRLRSPELLRLLLAWRLQAAVHGGLDAETRRRLRLRGRVQPEGRELGSARACAGSGAAGPSRWRSRRMASVGRSGLPEPLRRGHGDRRHTLERTAVLRARRPSR